MPEFTENVVLDDETTDSPAIVLRAGSHDDDIIFFNRDHATAGYSDGVFRLCDTGGESCLEVQDSAEAAVAWVDSDGKTFFTGPMGIGTEAPAQLLHIYDAGADVMAKAQTGKANGGAGFASQNDAQAWIAGISGGDDYQIRDDALCVVSLSPTEHSLLLPNLATEDLKIKDAGSADATEQDWIEVQVGGNTGYVRVFASK